MLGLAHTGHLVAVKRAMFDLPRFVLKAGRIIVERGEIRAETYGPTLHVAPQYDEGALLDIRKWFEAYYTIQFANYPVDESYTAHGATAIPSPRGSWSGIGREVNR